MSKKRTRKPAQGLGDTVENVLQATGIDKVAKFILGEDCGCAERKQKLNAMFPYSRPQCLTENEYNTLSVYFENKVYTLRPTDQAKIIPIYSRVFNVRQEPTSCSSCWVDIMNKLRKVYEEYSN